MGESGEEGGRTREPLNVYRKLKFKALEKFPEIVEDAVIEREPGSTPRNLRIFLIDDSFLDIWISEEKYSYHWQSKDKIVRFDNAPHHEDVQTFPHHRHIEEDIHDSPLVGKHLEDFEKVLKYVRNNCVELE
ncbi:MAG: DUF6516 family protein [Candidatus Nanohaloarchaea archaeon]|nr:DUF6516 family protein [Candidatus Nanohaloarchaea archaeon]